MQSLEQQISGWMTHLMQLDLEQTQTEFWPKKIREMEDIYHLSLTLLHRNDPSINQDIQQILIHYKVALASPSVDGNIKYIYVPLHIQDFILKIGPIPYPIYPQYNQLLLISILIGLAILVIITATIVFSRNLDKIYRITKQYSQGNFYSPPIVSRKSSLHTLYEHIVAMGAQLQQLLNNQRNLTRFMAHDCRTPVSTMRFAIHHLENQSLPGHVMTQVLSIKEDLNELNDLIDKFLNYERLSNHSIIPKKQHIAIQTWLTAIIDKYQYIAQKIVLKSDYRESDKIYVDPQLLKQVLTNLIDNAMKHGSTCIQVTAKAERDDVIFQVADDGVPIPEQDRQKIFQSFIRLEEDENRQQPGFGLGLAIVQEIVKAHHGEVVVSDTHLGGACFTIRIPGR